MQAFLVKLPSLVRYWTVVDDGYRVMRVADEYLQHLRLGQDAAESTTKAYAEALALYLRWCEQSSRDWRTAAGLPDLPRPRLPGTGAAAGQALRYLPPGPQAKRPEHRGVRHCRACPRQAVRRGHLLGDRVPSSGPHKTPAAV